MREDVKEFIQKNCSDCVNRRDKKCFLYFETEGGEIQPIAKIARNYLKYHYRTCDFRNRVIKKGADE